MIRGMICGYDSRTLIQCFPTSSMYGYLPTLTPKMFQLLAIMPYVERFGAGMMLPLRVLLSERCVHFGAGMVVPLECRCKVLVQGVACCQSGVYSLEWAYWWRSGCCCRCCLKVMLEGAAVRVVRVLFKPCCFGAGMLVSGCRRKVLLEVAAGLACWCCCKGDA